MLSSNVKNAARRRDRGRLSCHPKGLWWWCWCWDPASPSPVPGDFGVHFFAPVSSSSSQEPGNPALLGWGGGADRLLKSAGSNFSTTTLGPRGVERATQGDVRLRRKPDVENKMKFFFKKIVKKKKAAMPTVGGGKKKSI